MRRKILLGLALLFAGLQFVRPAKNQGTIDGPDFIGAKHPLPAGVRPVLQRACFDCHSNRTTYPWYAEVQPSGWWLASHVNEGKQHLNFSAFGSYSVKRQTRALDGVVDEITDRHMPLPSYTWAHRDAVLTPAEIKLLSDWADNLREEIAGNN